MFVVGIGLIIVSAEVLLLVLGIVLIVLAAAGLHRGLPRGAMLGAGIVIVMIPTAVTVSSLLGA